jgi:hypothetical protein
MLALSFLASAAARADLACDAATANELRALERFADSVRVDKPGLARVYAQDGIEFTAGEALWMKGQLRGAETACARGDPSGAGQRLQAVESLIQAHAPQNL